ncbi:hypothetical protein BB558_007360 [Smittium angustum]|uniref:Uncharacterized protein n=1 Tax=Smittium angustum TaxID=133377 RepID=A0A2U1IV92_SMIAN|nr:hypothetical protein BB558_007360 [Smittium angustum]
MFQIGFKEDNWNEPIVELNNSDLERFLKLKDSFELYTKSSKDKIVIIWNQINISSLENLVMVLKPIQETVEKLSANNSNIFIGNVAYQYIYINLDKLNTDISKSMLNSIFVHFKKRRNVKAASGIRLLELKRIPEDLYVNNVKMLEYLEKSEIHRTFKLNKEHHKHLQYHKIAL